MIFKDRFLKDNALMFFAMSVANLANLLCQIVIVRMLTVADYGSFNSLLSVFMLVSLPINAINTMVVKFSSAYNHLDERRRADFFLATVFRHMFLAGLLFLAAYLIFGFAFKAYLKLDSVLPVFLAGGMLCLTILSTVPQGALQGFERFRWFGAALVSNSVSKLLLVFIFLALGGGLLGALGGYLAAIAVSLLVSLLPLKEIFYLKGPGPDIGLREKYRFVIPSFIMLGCIAFLTNMDVIFVKHYFSAAEAGCYSVAQMIGKIVYFLPGAVYLVMMPRASGLHARKEDSRHLMMRSLKYVGILCLAAIVVYNLFPRLVMGVLTNKVNDQIITLGRFFVVIMAFYSLVNSLFLYHLSISRFNCLKWLALFTCLQVLGIAFFHESLVQVLSIMLASSAILFIISFRSAFEKTGCP
jgi:O-antigen/teichoic acid export membrane protein